MPFLRVIRDKRGYETTYLMHWYRDGTRQQSRVLYVFRSPGGVRVGRLALEPDVLRQLESQYPGIEFDWKSVFENRQVIEPPPDDRRPRKRRREEGEAPAPAVAPQAGADARAPQGPSPAAPPPRLVVPATMEGSTPDEHMAFLARWHSLLIAQIPKRTADPERQSALLALAARLDPADWTDADQITAGLQQAAEALERLSHVFAKRRRRARKPTRRTESAEQSGGVSAGPPEPLEATEDAAAAEPPEPIDPADAADAADPDPE